MNLKRFYGLILFAVAAAASGACGSHGSIAPRPVAIATIDAASPTDAMATPNVVDPDALFSRHYFPNVEFDCPEYFPLDEIVGVEMIYEMRAGNDASRFIRVVEKDGDVYHVYNIVEGQRVGTRTYSCEEGDVLVHEEDSQQRLFFTGRQPDELGFNLMPMCAIVEKHPVLELGEVSLRDVIRLRCYEGEEYWFAKQIGLVKFSSPDGFSVTLVRVVN